MQFRELGQSGIEVSVVCMGCWQLIGDGTWGEQREQDSIAAIEASLDAGVTFFDTAEGYGAGDSEELLGRTLGSRRKKVVLASKVSRRNLAPDAMREHLEASLKRLGTDYIDLYQVHWPSPKIPVDETLEAMEKLKDEGKIRAIGVSNFGVSYLDDVVKVGGVATNQLCYSLLWRPIEFEVKPKCVDGGIDMLCYSPLCQGLLTGKFRTPEDVPEGRARTRLFSGSRGEARHGEKGLEKETFEAIDRVRSLCEEAGIEMTHAALAWLLEQNGVAAVIAGARNAEQARDNAKAGEVELPIELVENLSQETGKLKQLVGPNADMWQSDSRMEKPGS